jgi:hypothetical protein
MKLKKDDYEFISKSVVKKVFEARFSALKLILKEFGDAMYSLLITEAVEELASKLPLNWYTTASSLKCNVFSEGNKWPTVHYFPLTAQRIIPFSFDGVDVVGENSARAFELIRLERELDKEAKLYGNKVHGFLLQYSTLLRLKKHWPEGKEFYAYLEVIEPAAQHMVILPDFINADLGLVNP